VTLAQRLVELLIGRLITDEQFRSEFLDDPENTLNGLCDRGLELSRTEIAERARWDVDRLHLDGVRPRRGGWSGSVGAGIRRYGIL
jgi:hypothetical protein